MKYCKECVKMLLFHYCRFQFQSNNANCFVNHRNNSYQNENLQDSSCFIYLFCKDKDIFLVTRYSSAMALHCLITVQRNTAPIHELLILFIIFYFSSLYFHKIHFFFFFNLNKRTIHCCLKCS